MDKRKIIIVSVLSAGFLLLIAGLATGSSILSETAGVVIILMIVIFMVEDYEEKRKPLLESMENKDKALLPIIKAKIMKKNITSSVISIIITVIIMAFLFILLKNNFMNLSDISPDKAMKDGCTKLNMGNTCITDPSTIIVPYDVNKDGKSGGDNDTFSNVMSIYYNCTGSCIRKQCGCPS